MKVLFIPFLSLILCCGCASTQKQTGNSIESPALQGKPGDVVVLIFASPDCPISNALAPEYERQHKDACQYTDQQEGDAIDGREYPGHEGNLITPDGQIHLLAGPILACNGFELHEEGPWIMV